MIMIDALTVLGVLVLSLVMVIMSDKIKDD